MKTGVLVLLMIISQYALSIEPIRNAGVKLGYVSSTLTSFVAHPVTAIERHAGFDAGVFVEWFNMPVFSLLTEAHFIQKGAEFVGKTEGEDRVISPRMNYLSFPILGKVRFLEQYVSPYIVGGLRVEFLLQSRYLGGLPESDSHFPQVSSGATIGAGLEIAAFESARFGIECRYSQDFTQFALYHPQVTSNNSMEFLIVAGF